MHGPARGRIRPHCPHRRTGSNLAELASTVAWLVIGGVGDLAQILWQRPSLSTDTFGVIYARTIATIAFTSSGCIRVDPRVTTTRPGSSPEPRLVNGFRVRRPRPSSQPLMYLGCVVRR